MPKRKGATYLPVGDLNLGLFNIFRLLTNGTSTQDMMCCCISSTKENGKTMRCLNLWTGMESSIRLDGPVQGRRLSLKDLEPWLRSEWPRYDRDGSPNLMKPSVDHSGKGINSELVRQAISRAKHKRRR